MVTYIKRYFNTKLIRKLISNDDESMAVSSETFFDTAVIDSNFFIGLTETGYDKRILPVLKDSKSTTIRCVIPKELPISDIPRRYRELRQRSEMKNK